MSEEDQPRPDGDASESGTTLRRRSGEAPRPDLATDGGAALVQRRRLRRLIERLGPLIALIVLMAITTWQNPIFLKPENLLNVLRQWSPVGIMAVGMTFVIILGGIDLSVGSLLAFAAGVGILAFNALHGSGPEGWGSVLTAFAVVLAIGGAAGALNGLLVTVGRVTPFIATLCGLAAYRSLALTMAGGGEYRGSGGERFQELGNGGIPIPGTDLNPLPDTVLPLTIPWAVVAFALIVLAGHVLLQHTRFGRYVFAIGANEDAARYSALPVRRIQIITYTLLGLCTGFAATLMASNMNSISSGSTGILTELDVIAAVVIGGTRMSGGVGTIMGTLVGVLLLGVIGNMLVMLNVSSYLHGLVKGAIILLAVLLHRPRSSN